MLSSVKFHTLQFQIRKTYRDCWTVFVYQTLLFLCSQILYVYTKWILTVDMTHGIFSFLFYIFLKSVYYYYELPGIDLTEFDPRYSSGTGTFKGL